MSQINVMLVDDHAVVRMGFKLLLESAPDIKVVAEAESGEQAIRAYDEHHPDVVVMDITMPGMGGMEAIERLMARDSGARVLVLSAHEDLCTPSACSTPGHWATSPSAARRKNDHGHPYRGSPQALSRSQHRAAVASSNSPGNQSGRRAFAARVRVFMALAQGKSTNEIAETLHLAAHHRHPLQRQAKRIGQSGEIADRDAFGAD